MDDDLKRLLDAMRQENTAAHVETRRHFDAVAERLENGFHDLAESVQHLDEKLDRTQPTSAMKCGAALPTLRR